MREILFRGKRTGGGEWVYGWYTMGCFGRWPLKDCIIPSQLAIDGELRSDEVDPSTVGQYTGLTDKNGKKIFEGDILRVVTNYYSNRNEHKITVNFEEIENDSFGEPYTIVYCIMGGEWEIIGNIHDNPELLKEAAND